MHSVYIIGLFVLLSALAFFGNNETEELSLQNRFNSWKARFNKVYSNKEEEVFRFGIYLQSVAKIIKLNMENSGATFGETQFMDLTQEEFKESYLTLKVEQRTRTFRSSQQEVNEDIDWTTKGAVTSIKDQGQCGGCYAFAAAGTMESANFLFGSKSLINLSQQQIIDCSITEGNQGCDGGWTDNAFKYIIADGITTEDEYPYVGKQQKCKQEGGAYKAKSYTDVKSGDCTSLASALMLEPIAVAVDASNWAYYTGGIFTNCDKNIDHAVIVVGMSSSYWKIKNSWGQSWGEQGYIRIGSGDTCGVCEYASYLNL